MSEEERDREKHDLQILEKMLQKYEEEAKTAASYLEKNPDDPERVAGYKAAAKMFTNAETIVKAERAELEKLESTRVSSEPSTPTVQVASSYAALELPPQGGKGMSRMMKVAVIVGFILATFFGYWFATEGYTIQSPIKEFNIEFQSPIVAPDLSNPEVGSENSEPDFGDAADPDEYSPPTGSGSIWVCEGPLGETEEGLPAYEHCVDP